MTAAQASPASVTTDEPNPTRWTSLVVVAFMQLVCVLGVTIVNIALPFAQTDLALSDGQRQWVVTAYVLTFGALLLPGGRVADRWGRKRTFLMGVAGFGVISVLGGFAQSGGELIAARGLQGGFAALIAPSAMALLQVAFPRGKDRATAFAVFGTVSSAGAAVGLILGGLLTQYADWRWCLFVNIAFAALAFVGGTRFLTESRAQHRGTFDYAGAVTVALGLGALVYGLSVAASGWTEPTTIAALVTGLVLLGLFVVVETRAVHPLLPLRVVLHTVRGGAFLIQALAGSVMIGALLYVSLHLQLVLGMTPVAAGVANIALPVMVLASAPVLTKKALPAFGPRPLLIGGPLAVAAGLFMLTSVTADGSFATQLLPGMLVMGVGMAAVYVPLQNLALTGVEPRDAGAASATVNAAMQIGGSLGLAIFSTVYATVTAAHAATDSPLEALASGHSAVFGAAAVSMVLAAAAATFLVRGTKEQLLPQHRG